MGYAVAPKNLMKEFQKVHQFAVFSVHHPTQKAFAQYLKTPSHYLELSAFYQRKRDLFLDLIKDSRFMMTPSSGTYFQLLDYSGITEEHDTVFAERLIKEKGIASIPTSVFNLNQEDFKMLRFCFAKTFYNGDLMMQKFKRILQKKRFLQRSVILKLIAWI